MPQGIHSNLSALDWGIVGFYLVVMLGVGFAYQKRGGASIESFFTGSRSLGWFLAGASLIATSFGCDTPIWVTGIIRQYGVSGAWQYWTYFLGAGLAVFLFSRYWRRIGVVTDIEFIEMRYGGPAAAGLRGMYALWTGILTNALIIAWEIKAMDTIFKQTLTLTPEWRGVLVAVTVVISVAYCAASGLLGVVVTDMLQFVLATVGTTALAWVAIRSVGGLSAMVSKLQAIPDWHGRDLNIMPVIGQLHQTPAGALSFWNFIAFVFILWWALTVSAGYIAQRLISTRDEKESSKAMLFYTITYWGINIWPWIIVALCSVILFPAATSGITHEEAYPKMIMACCPSGLRGVMFMALLAAFMSTIATLINYGASYFVNDFYKRFVAKTETEKHYVRISRLVTVFVTLLGGWLAIQSDSVLALVNIGVVAGSATCVLILMRWLWWRMNALSEMVGLIVSVILLLCFQVIPSMTASLIPSMPWLKVFQVFNHLAAQWVPLYGADGKLLTFDSAYDYLGLRTILVFMGTILASVITAHLTAPASKEVLTNFLIKARPLKILWRKALRETGVEYESEEKLGWVLTGWLSVTVCIFSMIMGLGYLLLGRPWVGVLGIAIFAGSLWLSVRLINQGSAGVAKKADEHA